MPEECGKPTFHSRIDHRNGEWSELQVEADTLGEAIRLASQAYPKEHYPETQELIRRLRRWPWRRDLTIVERPD
jgi:hypothetical protein